MVADLKLSDSTFFCFCCRRVREKEGRKKVGNSDRFKCVSCQSKVTKPMSFGKKEGV